MTRRAALYARVSTRRQEQEATIESQVAQLLSYAQEHGYDLPLDRQFVDQAISGQRLVRPGLDRLRDAAAAGAFEVLLCLSPDRLARNLGAQYVILGELRLQEIKMIFLNQPYLDDDPQAQLLLNIQGAFAEYERVLISERMRRGRLYRLRQGQCVPHQTPYGYRYWPATRERSSCWEVVAEQAAVVEQVFLWYTEAGQTLGQIAQRLNESRVPSPEGKCWTASTLGRMLRQPAYKGTAYHNRYQGDESSLGQQRKNGRGRLQFPRRVPRPVEEWIEIRVPAIVSEGLWQAAQERLEMQERFSRRNSRRPYLLRSLLVCDVCGYTLQGRTQKGTVTYVCTHGGKHCPPGVPRHTCTVRADVIEPLVWEALAELLRDPEQIQAAWKALQASEASADEVSRWKQRQTVLRKQRQRLLDAYQAEVINLEELVERQNPLDLELRGLEKRLRDAPQQPKEQISLEAFTQQIERALATCDLETQQEVLRLLIERIVVTDDAITIEHIVPTVDESRLDCASRVACCVTRFTRSQ
jgi:site-specific DNA recombinase